MKYSIGDRITFKNTQGIKRAYCGNNNLGGISFKKILVLANTTHTITSITESADYGFWVRLNNDPNSLYPTDVLSCSFPIDLFVKYSITLKLKLLSEDE